MRYKILKASSPINEEQLEALSDRGWNLIKIIQWRRWWRSEFYFYFSRPRMITRSDQDQKPIRGPVRWRPRSS